MAHIRKVLRDQLVTQLTGLVTTAGRVFQSRVYPMTADELPALVISNNRESVEYLTMSPPRTQMRTVEMTVGIYAKGVTGYDDTIDQVSAEVEAAIYSDATLGGYANDARITGVEIQFSGDGDQPIAIGVLNLEIEYTAAEGSPVS